MDFDAADFSPLQAYAACLGGRDLLLNIGVGAKRGGKTESYVAGTIQHWATDFDGGRFALGARSDKQWLALKQVKFDPWFARWGIVHQATKDGFRFRSYWGGWNHVMRVIAQDGAGVAASRLRGVDLDGGYLDELTLFPEDLVDEVLDRMSTTHRAKLTATTNPDSEDHWVKLDLIDRIERGELNGEVLTFMPEDNPYFLRHPEQLEALKARYATKPTMYRRMIESEWCSGSGLMVPNVTYLDTPDMGLCKALEVGLDWGPATVTAAVLVGWFPHGWHVIDEFYHDTEAEGQLLSRDIAEQIHAWATGYGYVSGWMMPPDAGALASDIHHIDPLANRVEGFEPTIWRVGGTVKTGMTLLNQRLEQRSYGRQLTVAPTCRNLRRERGSYRSKDGSDEHDAKSGDGHHLIDGLRYWAMANSGQQEMWI